MPDPFFLLADLGDLIKIGIFLIFILGPLLKGIFGGGEDKAKQERIRQQKAQQQRAQQQRAQQQQRAPQAGAGNAADRLEDEIEEFLRRAAGGQPPARQQPPPPPRRDVVPAQVVRAEQVRQQPKMPSQTSQRPQQKRAKPQRQQARKPDAPVRRLERQRDPVGGHADELGAEIDREIDRMESHVHEVFDHQIGSLSKEESESAEDVDNRGTDSDVWEGTASRRQRDQDLRDKQAAAMKEMIRDPKTVHQAIIMAEILKRPDY